MSTAVSVLDAKAANEGLAALCVKKSQMPLGKTVVLGLMAGAYIGFGCQLSTLIATDCPTYGPCRYLSAIGFSLGLMLIFFAGGELFTGNCMLSMAALAGRISVPSLLRNWGLVWTANFVGAIMMQAVIFGGAANGTGGDTLSPVGDKACAVYVAKADALPHRVLLNGISANMLVCLAVIMNAGSKTPSGRFLSALFPVAGFVAMGFEHSIANMNFFAMGFMLRCESLSFGGACVNLAMSTLGNIIGAGVLSAAYWYSFLRDDDSAPAPAAAPITTDKADSEPFDAKPSAAVLDAETSSCSVTVSPE
jgi:formate/nitrite transporter